MTASEPAPPSAPSDGDRGVKVYTRTGDDGSSCLFNMERRDKDDDVFEALGDVDELGVAIGVACAHLEDPIVGDDDGEGDALNSWGLRRRGEDEDARAIDRGEDERGALLARLKEIQSRLLDVGSAVATPLGESSEWKRDRTSFEASHATTLEAWIDEYDAHLPPLKTFILPSGGHVSARLHVARVVARRAERRCVPLIRRGDCVESVGVYLNRLSDFLYTAARFVAMRQGNAETPYKKAKAVGEGEGAST